MNNDNDARVFYVAEPSFSPTIRAVLIAVFALSIVAAIGIAIAAPEDALVSIIALVASTVATGLLIWALLPRRFELRSDGLCLALPLRYWCVTWDSIEEVRIAETWKAYGYAGWRFATDTRNLVEVRRVHSNMLTRPNLIITPRDRDAFVRRANAALNAWRDRQRRP